MAIRIMTASIVDRFGCQIDTGSEPSAASEFSYPVSRSATDIEHAAASGIARRKGVTSQVLRPKIVVDLAGNHAFAREFDHRSSAPDIASAAILELTSTRQGKWSWP